MKRITALFLTLIMIMNMLPMQAFATDSTVITEPEITVEINNEPEETLPEQTDRPQVSDSENDAETLPAEEVPVETDRPRAPVSENDADTPPVEEVPAETDRPRTTVPVSDIRTFTMEIAVPDDLPDSYALLKGFAAQQSGKISATMSTAGRDSLNAIEQQFYDYLYTAIHNVSCNGGSTVF